MKNLGMILADRLGTIAASAAVILMFLAGAYRYPLLRGAVSACEPFLPTALFTVSFIGVLSTWVHRKRNHPSARLVFWRRLQGPGRLSMLWPGLAVVCFLMPVIQCWTSNTVGMDNQWQTIGGLVPWSDALNWYCGAERVLTSGHMDVWCSRRPLNPVLLAVRLALTGYDLRLAILLQAILLGLACYWAAKAVSSSSGAFAGLGCFSLLLLCGRLHAASLASEGLGFTLSALSMCCLWESLRRRSDGLFCSGLFLLTAALNARAGAFLVLPALILWGALAFHKARSRRLRLAVLAVCSVAASFLLNWGVFKIYGQGAHLHANFSWALYGLATGGRTWEAVQQDFPNITGTDAPGETEFIYRKAVEKMTSEPSLLFVGILKGTLLSVPQLGWDLSNLIRGAPQSPVLGALSSAQGWVMLLFAILLYGFLAIGWVRFQRSAECSIYAGFLGFGLAGVLLSLPVIYINGGLRVLVSVFPILAVAIAAAVGGWSLDFDQEGPAKARGPGLWSILTGATLFLLALAGPLAIRELGQARPPLPHLESKNADTLLTRIGPDTPLLNIRPAASLKSSFAPEWRLDDFSKIPIEYPTAALNLGAPATFVLCLDYGDSQLLPRYVVMPLGAVSQDSGSLEIHIEPVPGTPFCIARDWKPLEPIPQIKQGQGG